MVALMTSQLLALIIGLLLYAVLHSLLVAPGIRHRLEKLVPSRAYRLLYNVVATVLLALLWLATDTAFPVLWNLHGIPALLLRLLQGAAAVLFLLALRSIDLWHFLGLRQLLGAPPEEARLVTHGAYTLCRHPTYLSVCVFFSAWPRMDLRWLVVAIWLWLYCLVGSIFEERRLEAQFGQAYRSYRAAHPRLLPFRLWPGKRH